MKPKFTHAIQSQIDAETWEDEYVDLSKEEAIATTDNLRKEYSASMTFRVVERSVADKVIY